MSSTSSDTNGSAEPHILCNYCQTTCDSSIIIQTYTKYGNDEDYAALRQRCSAKRQETFRHCSVTDFQAGYQAGCHLCSMLWHRAMGTGDTMSRLMQEMKDFEEKNGISQSVLVIHYHGVFYPLEVSLCTLKESELLSGPALGGYLVRDFQGNVYFSFPLSNTFKGVYRL